MCQLRGQSRKIDSSSGPDEKWVPDSIAKSVFKVIHRSHFYDPLNKCMRPNVTRKCGSRARHNTSKTVTYFAHTVHLFPLFADFSAKSTIFNFPMVLAHAIQRSMARAVGHSRATLSGDI